MTTDTVQLLTPEGDRVHNPRYPLDDVDIKGMYRDMVLVRRIDTEAIDQNLGLDRGVTLAV